MRRVGHQRREQLIVDDAEVERARRAALRFERERDRNHARPGPEPAGDRRRAILQERADDLAGGRQLHRREQARQHGVDVRARHRELGRPEVVHRVAEGVDAIAVDVGHRAGGAELQVAADEHHADRVARLQRPVERHLAGAQAGGAAAGRDEALIAERAAETFGRARARSRTSRAAWRSAAAACRAAPPPRPATALTPVQLRVVGPSANGRFQLSALRNAAVRFSRVSGNSTWTRAPGGRGVVERRRVGHLGDRRDAGDRLLRELPSEYDTAPISRPSM